MFKNINNQENFLPVLIGNSSITIIIIKNFDTAKSLDNLL